MNRVFLSLYFITASLLNLTSIVFSQQGSAGSLTTSDYQHAEKFMGYNTNQLVDRANVRPDWLPGERFWYRVLTPLGSEFILVDPAHGTRVPAFDQLKLAVALSTVAGGKYEGSRLPFSTFDFSPDGNSISFSVARRSYKCDIHSYSCALDNASSKSDGFGFSRYNEIFSPDKKRAAFISGHNLWVRDVATGKETQMTTDGIKDFGYATDNAGWTKSDRPVVTWSSDSKKIATYQQDQRNVSDMYLVSTNVGQPRLESWKYPLPGDKNIIMIQRVIIEVDNPKVIRLKLSPDPHRGTILDDISRDGNVLGDVEWNKDATQLAFVSTSRDHKQEKFYIADASTGSVREVFTETALTQFESGPGSASNWRYLAESNEIIWFSERDNWGHLYLYDATTGKLKNQITKGDWTITELLRVDEKNRMIYFLADGHEPGRNPYFDYLYRVKFDGKNLALLSPEDGNHQISLSPSGKYFIDSYSKQDIPPVSVLRSADGKLVSNLEKTDISRLTATGWKPPAPIVVKARDGQLDLYGLMYTPTNLDPQKKYPVVNYIYPGPQGGSIGSWSFSPANGDNQALSELGFIVIAIEGTCNPSRSKSFHDLCYGNMADNTLPDQISGIQQLARKYPYIDTSRVGIWGHSGGGYATAAAMFRFPDFYKVGISESGNHDNRNYEDDWGERYIGLLTEQADGKSNYAAQANQVYAKNLKGKLMIAFGNMDDNVPPYNSLLVVDALIKANKDFDLVVFPNSRHGYGEFSLYMTRRRWDYFVRYLQGSNPPKEYELKATFDVRGGGRQ